MSTTLNRNRRLFDRKQSIGYAGNDRLANRPEATNPLFTPFSDLDLMIANGWGDTPQTRLPKDWRTRTRIRVGSLDDHVCHD